MIADPPESGLRLEVVDRVAVISIDRPDKRNAMSSAMWTALLDHLRTIQHDPDVVAVLLRGEGGSFSAGGDLAELQVADARHVDRYRQLAEEAVHALTALDRPKVAAIDGTCFGAGCSLALACDVRIATPTSTFAIPSLRNGLVYEPAFVHRLVDVVGSGLAGLLLLGGERWSGEDAAMRGLVDRCASDVATAVDDFLTALRAADPHAIVATTAAVRGGLQRAAL
ncbi:enoyl-CoA hydratase/isomerase family protein [Aeromicrobium sp. CTD01-1L150]|uniref:enoyl-CoA hydratase/isomerase family protein n=1 Tax=Aeromicrobium sp. CTD01-1L150 TaxID=3341830 RepID=UPI0035BFA839